MRPNHLRCLIIILGLIASGLGACTPARTAASPAVPSAPPAEPQLTPLITAAPATLTPTKDPGFTLWVSPAVPEQLKSKLSLPGQVTRVDQPVENSLSLAPTQANQPGLVELASSRWVYALVAPFPTLTDGVSLADLKAAWQGEPGAVFQGHRLIVAENTRLALEGVLGKDSTSTVNVLPADQLLDFAWKDMTSWAIVPFEVLQPRWKVLRVDGSSPFDKSMDPSTYPLAVRFSLVGPASREGAFGKLVGSQNPLGIISSNRDPSKMTVVVMTGVTALVRSTANKMDTKGLTYPGKDIRDWLREADITHVSNEVSFDPSCPPGNPGQVSLQFCSRPEYIELLKDVGVNVVELTGNHLNDWSRKALVYTLDLYDQNHIQYFAGGRTLEEARKPLLIENHGNKIAFIGCNPAGPDFDWATATGAGAAPCDLDWEAKEIADLRMQGYLPIATFQYFESYSYTPMPWQLRDFRKISEAGAVIVSGSQAHFPQTIEFDQGNLIHYGLGNLFFDQMAPIIYGRRVHGTEREFIDRHIFYDGKYLGTELLTAMLEDYAKPRPMTTQERASLLTDVFTASGWMK